MGAADPAVVVVGGPADLRCLVELDTGEPADDAFGLLSFEDRRGR